MNINNMNKYIFLCLTYLSAFALQSCYFSEDDIFDQSPSERVDLVSSEYKKILTDAPNGWLMEYYPGGETHDIGGVVWLLKFSGEEVTVMSDSQVQGYDDPEPTLPGESVTSIYRITSEQGAVLSFSTYNSLIHYYSEPRGGFDADGFQGDFEFIITSATADKVHLKGKKHGTAMTMKRLPSDMDWTTYINDCQRIYNESAEYGTLVGFHGDAKFAPSAFAQENVITFSEQGEGGQLNKRKVSFAYTDMGIRLYEPTNINGQTLYEFKWNNADKTFYSTTNENTMLRYVRPDDYVPIEFYTENDWELSYTFEFGMKDTVETVRFTRIEDTDTLKTKISAGNIKFDIKAIYNHTTGMLEFRTQYLNVVMLTLTTGENIDAYIYLCPWNDEAGTMYMTEKAGIVSHTTNMTPRELKFTDNGRTAGSDLNGFVLYGFGGREMSSEKLGVLGTYNEITFKQKIQE